MSSVSRSKRPVTEDYLDSSWSKLSSRRPERSAMDMVLLNLLFVPSFILACILAWAMTQKILRESNPLHSINAPNERLAKANCILAGSAPG